MELPKVIDQLEELIADRESFIYSDGEARGIYIADKEALEEAVKVLTVIRDKRQVTFTVYPEGVFYDAKDPERQLWQRGILMEPEEDRPHIKIQYKGEELTIKELTDRLDKASADRDRYKRLSEARKKQVDELEKQYEVTEFCPHCESEITITWDTETYGYKAYCPVCGGRLMLCSACHDDTNGSCDYNGETDTCRFNQNSSSLDTADEIAAKTDLRANVTQLMEEAAELIAACSKYLRACGIGQPTPVTVDEALAMIGEEAEDVNLVTDVIRRQSEAVEDVFVETANRKILRWKGRLENGKQG